jgi:hypothetical protein
MSKSPQDQQEIERLRASLEERLRRAPTWVNGASIQAVRDWKEAHKRAKKVALKKSPTATELLSAIQSVA